MPCHGSILCVAVLASNRLRFLALCFTVLCVNVLSVSVLCVSVSAQTGASTTDSPPDLLALQDKVVEVVYTDGSAQWPLKVTQVVEGTTPGTLKYIKVQFKQERKQRKINANKIDEIILDDQHLDVEFDKKQRGLIHSPEKRKQRLKHRDEVIARLKKTRDRLWQPVTPEASKRQLTRQKEKIEKTKSHFPKLDFRVVETEFFTVCTDLTSTQVDGYLVSLDTMYRELCVAFGIPPTKNIWVGKCLVFAFSRKSDFYEFESAIMDNEAAQGTAGLCHQSSNGGVLFAGYRGESDTYFGTVLIHETAHGFVHRYLSSAQAPSWLNEGMSDWIANAIMKNDAVPRKQIKSANLIKKSGTWGDFLTAPRIEFDYYGSASTLVEILLRRDKGGQFRAFFRSIKEGKSGEESLKDSFGLSYQDLKILYAQQLEHIPTSLP